MYESESSLNEPIPPCMGSLHGLKETPRLILHVFLIWGKENSKLCFEATNKCVRTL